MSIVALICLIAAAVLLGLATFSYPPGMAGKVNLVAGGLFFGLLGILVERIPGAP